MKKILYIIAAGAMLLASCSKENNTPEADGSPVQFSTEIATRASGTAWDAGDQIGVFMLTAGGTTLPGDIVGNGTNAAADNVQYTYTASGFSTTTPIYYPVPGAVDFVAYYPYRIKPASDPYIYKVDVSAQTTPAAIDLLWSANAVNVARSKTAVPLQFDHKLSRVVLNITKGEGMATADLSAMGITIEGMPTKADFNLADGTFSSKSAVANITPRIVSAGTTYEAIVIPQAGTTGRKMVFTVGTDVYECPIPNTDDFLSGKSYAYTVTVKKTSVSISRGAITDWTGTGGTPGDIGTIEQLPIAMVLIPAGTFIMGSPDGSNGTTAEPNRGNNETQHKVTLTKDFYMSKYPITFAQYDAYCDANNITPKPGDQNWGRGDRPVINVSWNDAVGYCEWLSTTTGLTYRLPTEAQWEYACRGDYANKETETTTLPFGIGDGRKLISGMANYYIQYSYDLDYSSPGRYDVGNNTGYLGKTNSVGSYSPNNYGLYDMHGNVLEWCSDKCNWPPADYGSSAVTDPLSTAGTFRVLRGGYWFNDAQYCRSADRSYSFPVNADYGFGFRVVFVP